MGKHPRGGGMRDRLSLGLYHDVNVGEAAQVCGGMH